MEEKKNRPGTENIEETPLQSAENTQEAAEANLPNEEIQEQPVGDESAPEENKTVEPEQEAAEVSVAEEPAAKPEETAVAEEPAAEEPVADEPAAEEPVVEPEVAEPQPKEVVTEEPVAEEPAAEPEVAAAEEPAAEPEGTAVSEEVYELPDDITKEQLLEKLKELVEAATDAPRQIVEALKQAYYRIQRQEKEAAAPVIDAKEDKEAEAATEEAPKVDENDELFKSLMKQLKDKRAALLEQQDLARENNYQLKLAIIDELKQLTESQDDFSKLFAEFKNLQQRWKEITNIPQSKSNELWKNYHYATEKLYDLIKINIEMRDYDFKKNLELKTALCEAVEKLANEKDVISAFHQLQKLHDEWREIGPVGKDIREEMWQRFKEGSAVINKRHHEHFEKLKGVEQENLTQKEEICKAIEEIDLTILKSFKEWDEAGNQVIELQQKWRTIGFAPKKDNNAIFARFRAACDNFFSKKSDFVKGVRSELATNLSKKKSLCGQAEALKESTDWKETSDKMIALQKEWKTIGPVSRKDSDAVWKRFVAACDYFFEQKTKNTSSQRTEEQENLKQKQELINELMAFTPASVENPIEELRNYIARFNQIGFVPFREKDKVYKAFHTLIDEFFNQLKVDKSERQMANFRSSINEMSNAPKGKILNERDRLMRAYERLKSELQTYENNIGFLSVSSKGGNSLVKEMERKVEQLKEEIALTVKKIEAIDENLEKSE